MVAKHPQPAVISHTIHGEHQNRVFWAGILNRDDKGIEILLPTCVYIYICITLYYIGAHNNDSASACRELLFA